MPLSALTEGYSMNNQKTISIPLPIRGDIADYCADNLTISQVRLARHARIGPLVALLR